jgi:hypothetical protein
MRAHLVGPTTSEIRLERDAFDGRFGVQLEGQPRYVDQTLLFQLFDSNRVDVAPGSNVVGEDDQLDPLDCLSHLCQEP